MPTAKKISVTKKNLSNSKNTTFHRPIEEIIDKLPDISPKKVAALRSSSIISPKTFVKNYEFSP
jgi:hypothetical protein